jgi:hypothetical protein
LPSPEPVDPIELAVARRRVTALLSCGWLFPRRLPGALSRHGFRVPTLWFVHFVVFANRARTG